MNDFYAPSLLGPIWLDCTRNLAAVETAPPSVRDDVDDAASAFIGDAPKWLLMQSGLPTAPVMAAYPRRRGKTSNFTLRTVASSGVRFLDPEVDTLRNPRLIAEASATRAWEESDALPLSPPPLAFPALFSILPTL